MHSQLLPLDFCSISSSRRLPLLLQFLLSNSSINMYTPLLQVTSSQYSAAEAGTPNCCDSLVVLLAAPPGTPNCCKLLLPSKTYSSRHRRSRYSDLLKFLLKNQQQQQARLVVADHFFPVTEAAAAPAAATTASYFFPVTAPPGTPHC
jgi:hypothetical protein